MKNIVNTKCKIINLAEYRKNKELVIDLNHAIENDKNSFIKYRKSNKTIKFKINNNEIPVILDIFLKSISKIKELQDSIIDNDFSIEIVDKLGGLQNIYDYIKSKKISKTGFFLKLNYSEFKTFFIEIENQCKYYDNDKETNRILGNLFKRLKPKYDKIEECLSEFVFF